MTKPDVQKIAIQDNTKAFSNCKTVSHFIQDSIDAKLKAYNLSMMAEPLFDKKEFWNLLGPEVHEKLGELVFADLKDKPTPDAATIAMEDYLKLTK